MTVIGKLVALACVTAVGAVTATALRAQAEFPSRTVTVVGYSVAGGPVDLLARILADGLQSKYGKPAIVENKPGAAGIVASLYLKNQPPDGHTLLYGTMTTAIFAPQIRPQVPYDTRKDFTPVALTMGYALLLVANASVPFNNPPELIAYAKANPGKLNYGTNGFGAWTHIAVELFTKRTGIDIVHVPFTGNAPSLQAVLAGDIQLAMVDINLAMPHIESGKIKVIAQLNDTRTPQFPNVHTFGETVPELATPFWLGIFGPPNMPKELVARINRDINEVTASQATRKRADQAYMQVQTTSADDFAARVARDWELWGKVVRDNNLIMK